MAIVTPDSTPRTTAPVMARVHRDPVVALDGRVLGYTITLSLDMAPGIPSQVGASAPETYGAASAGVLGASSVGASSVGGPAVGGPAVVPAPVEPDPTEASAHAAPTPWSPGGTPAIPAGVAARAAGSRLGALLHEQYLALDLANLVADRFAFVPATPEMLDGFVPTPAVPGHLVLDLPHGFEHRDDAQRRAAALRGLGVVLGLSGYRGEPAQVALLPLLAFVTLDSSVVGVAAGPGVETADLAGMVRTAHHAGVSVLADDVDAVVAARCRTAGVDALRGGVSQPASGEGQVLRAGQLQCLAVMHLLNEPDRDLGKVAEVIDTDPVLTLRTLHLVNSGAFALRREVDTVHQAVILLGPRELSSLVAALALDARPGAMDSLWRILARALTCESLADDPAGYTVGMLSALIEELGVPADVVLEKVGVSQVLGDAVRSEAGPLGAVLGAVVAHERRDYAKVLALGIAPLIVSDEYLRCLASALATARAVTPS